MPGLPRSQIDGRISAHDERARAFEHDHAAVARSDLSRSTEPIALHLGRGLAEQARRLRPDAASGSSATSRVAPAPADSAHPHRSPCGLIAARARYRTSPAPTRPARGPDRSRRRPRARSTRPVPAPSRLRGTSAPAAGRRSRRRSRAGRDRHESGAGAQCGLAGHSCSARHADAAADHEHVPCWPLCVVRRRGGNSSRDGVLVDASAGARRASAPAAATRGRRT